MTDAARPLPKHPAKFSDPVLDALGRLVNAEQRALARRVLVLDPFAGVGRIHNLRRPGKVETLGTEIEAEWAACHSSTLHADALVWMAQTPPLFDIVATSPTYGNRMADHHDARDGSRRHSYRHDLGRMPTGGSSSVMAWGPTYWAFHAEAYRAMYDVLAPGGLLLLNVSDFYRRKAVVPAVEWHRGACMGAGFDQAGRDVPVITKRLRGVGAEATAARADHEVILRLRKPPKVVLA